MDERPPRLLPPGVGRQVERRSRTERPRDWLDELIQDAEARGLFRDLAGRGRPLDLSVNPFEPREWRLGHRLLREHGFAPEWIQLDREIRAGLDEARRVLETALQLMARAPAPAEPSPARGWRRALARLQSLLRPAAAIPPPDPGRLAAEAERRFRERVAEVNRLIERYNLLVPIPWLQRRKLDAEAELAEFRRRAGLAPSDPAADRDVPDGPGGGAPRRA